MLATNLYKVLGKRTVSEKEPFKNKAIEKDIKDKSFDEKNIVKKAKKYLKNLSVKDTVNMIFKSEKINKKKIYQLCLKIKNEKTS